jgi:hypothetical protein
VRRLGRAARGRWWAGLVAIALAGGTLGCATFPAVGRGGPVYEVRVESIDGNHTALRGPAGHPACVVQVADRVATVWLASQAHADHESPVVFEADAEALKEGILVERSWNQAVVHNVTDAELAAGAALVSVPSGAHPITVELRFDPVSRLAAQTETAKTTLPNTARDSSSR